MRTTRLRLIAGFVLVLLFVAACLSSTRRTAGHGVRGGTLRVLSASPMVHSLDTADAYTTASGALERTYARRLYGFDTSGPPDGPGALVPDLATGLPQVSPDGRTYTFTLRAGVRYAQPVNREVVAEDFVTAVKRLYDKETPSPGQLSTPTSSPGRQRSGTARRGRSGASPRSTATRCGSRWQSRPATSCRS